jgi:triosephosphate isomerase
MKILVSSLLPILAVTITITITATGPATGAFTSAFAFSPTRSTLTQQLVGMCTDSSRHSVVLTRTPTRTTTRSTSLHATSYLQSLSGNGINVHVQPQPQQEVTSNSNYNGRRTIVAGNWKLNPSSKEEAISLLNGLKTGMANTSHHNKQNDNVEVVIFPPLPFVQDALSILDGTSIKVGAQTASSYSNGAYTGEVAPSMLESAGCSYILLGHSERRTLFGESDVSINAKIKTCLNETNLKVILCIGETLEEYEAGLLNSIVDTQLRKGLAGVSSQDLLNDRIIIAYEPVWAIGTGLVATPDQAQAAHLAIRNTLSSMYYETPNVSTNVRIQYGGSVKPDSVKDLMLMPDVDGTLVGGASLDADSFTQIVLGSSTTVTTSASTTANNALTTSTTTSTPIPPTATTSDPSISHFIHAPLSYFSIDKLTSKGPRKNPDVGSPHDSTRKLASIGNIDTGSWWCAAGGWPSPNPRATTEIFYVYSGHACVTDMDGTRHYFGPGDVVILPKNWKGRWDIFEDIHKVWVVVDHPDVDATVVRSDKAIIKPYSNFSPHMLTCDGVRKDATHGEPVTASDEYLENGYMDVGVWTCMPGSFPGKERTTTEVFHVLEGLFFLTNVDGTARRCVAGDTVVLPKGWRGYWDVIEKVKKVWVTTSL